MKKIVYHDTELLASRAYKPAPGETVAYRSIKEFDEVKNKEFDEVLNFSKKKALKPEKE